MPSSADEKGHKNLTLRLPEELHRQLVQQASLLGQSLNSHFLNILSHHLMECGYFPGVIKSFSGRLFQIEVSEITRGSNQFFASRFDIFECHSLYQKRRARYIFGLETRLAAGSDPYGILKDVGLALLNFYNRKAFEIDQLAWKLDIFGPDSPDSSMKDNWRFIGAGITSNVSQFLITLAKNHWTDEMLFLTGQSQDLRLNLRTEDELYR